MIIILLGYMGSGKSTLGKELATVLNYNFLDLDDYISEKENSSISNLFKTKGEIYFRKKETEYLKQIIDNSNNYVLSLGGGTPCYSENMALINNSANVVSFYLKLAIPLLSERLFTAKEQRPLISHITSKEDMIEFIGKHLFERIPYYSKAKYTINTDNKSLKEVLESILTHLI
ncbi:shikimate kinase [Winogradskyella litoriviva]|uniref:Shikimate kinase n=1 Tax=Winogradskyella litoriviva TaxID=1220182 RepID=A0ABX2E2Y7_9FLAO|nr:shikimate kinase [Winogradskyella litoriviva]NRD22403.1 shikimate kinase [Winogradskyella litoriviva]